MSRDKAGPTPKRRDSERKRTKARRHFRTPEEAEAALITLDGIRAARNEGEKQRQWSLDKSAGHKAPEHYDYPEDRDDNTPIGRTEKRFLDKFAG